MPLRLAIPEQADGPRRIRNVVEDVIGIHRKGVADGLTLKISRLGGLTMTRQIRDMAVDLGFMITVEDTGGAEIDTAAWYLQPMIRAMASEAYATAETSVSPGETVLSVNLDVVFELGR